MKKAENLKSAILMLVVTGVAIGLLSSTALKLASATQLLKQTNGLGSVNFSDSSDDTPDVNTPVQTPVTPAPNDTPATPAPTTPSQGTTDTGSGNETEAPDDSSDDTSGDSSGGSILDTIMGLIPDLGGLELPDLGGIIGGNDSETSDDAEDKIEVVDSDSQSVMTSYRAVVEKAKLSPVEFEKKTIRSIDWSFINTLLIGNANNLTVDGVKYFGNEITTSGVANSDPEFVINNRFACLIDPANAGEVAAAVESAEKTVLEDGNTKLVIRLNDEINPEALVFDDREPSGFISSVLPVLTADDVRVLFNENLGTNITEVNVTYTGCSIELVYDAVTGDIVSLNQVINYNVEASGARSFDTTITEVNTYTFN